MQTNRERASEEVRTSETQSNRIDDFVSTRDTAHTLPELPLDAWKPTKMTLHLYAQIVGKIRLALNPQKNHWWHVPLYVSPRGLTTRTMPAGSRRIEIEFDLVDHNLLLRSSSGQSKAVSLYHGLSVAQFYRATMSSLAQLGVDVSIIAHPYDPGRVGSDLAFARDEVHASYQVEYIERFRQILGWIDTVFEEFSVRFAGKSSPVHLFWHSFDLAYARFSGRAVPLDSGSIVDREAYSHELISFGFWAGDDNMPAPSFYSYTYPEPDGLAQEPLAPGSAFWAETNGSHMALLPYHDLRGSRDPAGDLLRFLQSAYLAGASRAGWDIQALRYRDLEE